MGLILFAILAVAAAVCTAWRFLFCFPYSSYAVWNFRPQSGGQAACRGALSLLVGLCLFFLIGTEGAICIVMAAPLALPLGALGGWLAYRERSSKRSGGHITMLILLPHPSHPYAGAHSHPHIVRRKHDRTKVVFE